MPDPQFVSGITPLGKLSQAMNFQRLPCPRIPTLVTLDHRAVLVAAWAALQEELFSSVPDLFRLDAHLDMGEKPRPWQYEESLLTNLDAVQNVVNSTRVDDGGWVIPAIQWGFCRHVYSGCIHEYHRFPGDNGTLRDYRGGEHHLNTESSLSGLLQRYAQSRHSSVPLWVDIDLDFATTRQPDGSVTVWTEQEWDAQFPSEVAHQFAELIHTRAALVTIALEPWFCGGVYACGLIAREFEHRMKSHTDVFNGLS